MDAFVTLPSHKAKDLFEPDLAYVSIGVEVAAVAEPNHADSFRSVSNARCFNYKGFGYISTDCRKGIY